jgi:hypothetical protein
LRPVNEKTINGMAWRVVAIKKIKMQTAAGNIMASLFWDSEGNLSEEFLESGATLNCEQNVQTLMKLKQRVRRVRPDRKIHPVLLLLLQDKARPHTSPHTGERIETVGWLVSSASWFLQSRFSTLRLPYFGPLNEALRGRRFAKYDELKHGVHEEFQGKVLHTSHKGGKSLLVRKEALWKNGLNL